MPAIQDINTLTLPQQALYVCPPDRFVFWNNQILGKENFVVNTTCT